MSPRIWVCTISRSRAVRGNEATLELCATLLDKYCFNCLTVCIYFCLVHLLQQAQLQAHESTHRTYHILAGILV